jgi:putative flippase GtrA
MSFATFVKHQTGALVATAVDFATMIFLVEALGFSAVSATALGAACGAITNFTLGRAWIFRRHDRDARAQALRYAAVSTGSLGLNTLGEALVTGLFGVPYALARVVVAVTISVLFNFPLHRGFVFREAAR